MNEVIKNILTRRSIRSFQAKKISKEDLDFITQAAIYAPSARNLQSWNFTVVQNKEMIDKLAKITAREIKQDDFDFYDPDVLIFATNDKNCKFGREDCSCALQNIFLAAHSLGIGSVWVNQLFGLEDVADLRELLSEMNIPENHMICGVAVLGYADSIPGKPVKNKNNIRFVL